MKFFTPPSVRIPSCFHPIVTRGLTVILALTFVCFPPCAQAQQGSRLGAVFVIAMENHNWTQPNGNVSGTALQQIKNNPNAPFINRLVNGTATATINGVATNISLQTAYCDTYYNVLANAQSSVNIHPSEPNYIWAEAGSNLGVFDDNDPYEASGGTNQATTQHLSSYLSAVNISWKSYQEDIDIDPSTGLVLPQNQWTVPLVSNSGTFLSTGTANRYNGSLQYDYAAKHNPMVFFTDTNGGNDTSVNNVARRNYAPLQQLLIDLSSNSVSAYNWITPDQFNDMHSELDGGFKGLTGDSAMIAQGDNFLSILVPLIMASPAYQNNGVIIIRMDETEDQDDSDTMVDDFNHTIPEIVISPLAHPNVNGLPYRSVLAMTHSSDLKMLQQLFLVGPNEGYALLGDAATASTNSLSDLFVPTIQPIQTPLTALAINRLASGHVLVQFLGVPNRTYAVQATTDLSNVAFTTVTTVTADVNGAFSFEDTNAASFARRFYRAMLP